MPAAVITPTTREQAERLAVWHLRAALRLWPRYGTSDECRRHVETARDVLDRALRSEDDTREVPTP